MQEYQITLLIDNHTHKPKRIFKYRVAKNHNEAWEKAREVCSEYNRSHKIKAVITGVGKN